MRIRLSIAIMTHNEHAELVNLFAAIESILARDDVEVIIVDDFSDSTMQDTFKRLGLRPFHRRLNGDFAAQRNYAKQMCKGDYVIFLDPDEIPAPTVCATLMALCDKMERDGIETCAFPRMNILVDDPSSIDAWQSAVLASNYDWAITDYQLRLCRNVPHIKWRYPVHEKLRGSEVCYLLSPNFDNCLIHIKAIQRQTVQNQHYDKIRPFSLRNIAKRMNMRRLARMAGFIKEAKWVPLNLAQLASSTSN